MELRKRLRIQEKERQLQVVEWFNTKKAVGEENAQRSESVKVSSKGRTVKRTKKCTEYRNSMCSY